MKRALVSVSDKTNIGPFISALVECGYEIISTGGTYKALKSFGVDVKLVREITGFTEILDGRVKTLHPKIHGGLLAIRNNELHQKEMLEQGIEYIDLLCVNLYPFKETILKDGVSLQDAIENIDIGGPAMLRSAAKNYQDVTVVCEKEDYELVLNEIKSQGDTTNETRSRLAAKAFRHTAAYDALIANYFSKLTDIDFPEKVTLTYELKQMLRYGENPHQKAAFYKSIQAPNHSLVNAKILHGKELSYNNIQDANAALEILSEYEETTVVAVKHMNPCGIGSGEDLYSAYQKAYEADPVSIFGGVIATNQLVDLQTALKMAEIFLEIIIAPQFSVEALEILKTKKNLRLLTIDFSKESCYEKQLSSVNGGLLIQETDHSNHENHTCVTKRVPTLGEWKQLTFAWKAVKHVKSNAIVIVKNNQTIGVGAGQMNRVGAARIAILQAGNKCIDAVMASDAFFPMRDTVEVAAKAGVTALIQPGGSIKDQDSIDLCNQYGMTMVFTRTRHFKH